MLVLRSQPQRRQGERYFFAGSLYYGLAYWKIFYWFYDVLVRKRLSAITELGPAGSDISEVWFKLWLPLVWTTPEFIIYSKFLREGIQYPLWWTSWIITGLQLNLSQIYTAAFSCFIFLPNYYFIGCHEILFLGGPWAVSSFRVCNHPLNGNEVRSVNTRIEKISCFSLVGRVLAAK